MVPIVKLKKREVLLRMSCELDITYAVKNNMSNRLSTYDNISLSLTVCMDGCAWLSCPVFVFCVYFMFTDL